MPLDARHRWIVTKIQEGIGLEDTVAIESVIRAAPACDTVSAFFEPDGPQKLMFVYQPGEPSAEGGDSAPASLQLTSGELERLTGKCVYFVRTGLKGVSERTLEQDMMMGMVSGAALESYTSLVSELYLPILKEQSSWGKNTEENTSEFMTLAGKFSATLNEAMSSLQGGVELRKPEKKYLDQIELKPQAFNRAATDTEVVEYFEGVLEDWCAQTERLLDEGEGSRKETDDAGPDTELEFWRNRMTQFNSVTEQLKSKECKLVLGVCLAARSKGHRTWKAIDLRVTDAANEAKDNVKYLSTLEKSLEPMYLGTPQSIIDSLPALMNNIKLMHTIARYYNTPERMTTLFCKITSQMITNCKAFIKAPAAKLWDQDPESLLANLQLALRLNEAYQEQYKLTRDRLMSQPKGKQFDFAEARIFGRFDLFCKRVSKLIDMFTTVTQFSSLAQHTHIEGLADMISSFYTIVEEMKKKPYDLLEFTKNQFDRDFYEFNVEIHHLEEKLQAFINASFENISSTEHALNLLRQFQSILQRDSLKADLDEKYLVIFSNYGMDLDAVQKLYERHKASPPMARNAPPVSGAIMWSRQLLRRIEEPMKKFAANKAIMATKESKRIVKTYNKVARALIEFETLWHQAWVKSIEASKAGLQATLIVRHPETGKLLVNFDREIMQLMREAKYLQRMGIDVPESARMVLLQEEKFKHYYNQLNYALGEHGRVLSQILQVARPLLGPHLDDLERRLQPGMYILTWTSMNIDGYLHRIHAGLSKLEQLVSQINTMVESRIESNLKAISKTPLVDLPADQSFTFEEFVARQAKYIKQQSSSLAVRNTEVQNAVEDLVQQIRDFPRENNDVLLQEADVAAFRAHYSKLLYNAVLRATKESFNAMKKRLGSRSSGGFLFVERPFFDVDVELTVPNVSMNPSLDDIQGSINLTAKRVLRASADLEIGTLGTGEGGDATYYDRLASDKEIVKSVLLLTGSIEGTKAQVAEYIATFDRFGFLWKHDMQAEYAAFMKTNPSLEAFEEELKKYMAIEREIATIAPVHNIGCMSLETQPMKYSLKAEAGSWKAQFARNLHLQGFEDLKDIQEYMRQTTLALGHKVEDLEDVRTVMGVLREVREREAEIDSQLSPIEEMYALLVRYEVRVPKDELDSVGDLRYGWRKLRKLAQDVTDNLGRLQVGFKRTLVKEVKVFTNDAKSFRNDFEANGPMVPGLEPMEAVNRLKKYQSAFSTKKHRWTNFAQGEELFGLPITQYPELVQTERELELLDKLYSLFVNVITTIEGYGDMLWVDVQGSIDQMTEQVNAFQSHAKKLPKSLKDWEAFRVCKKTIDDFLELLPLLTELSSKSMRSRHWQQMMAITGKQLNLAEDAFRLQHLLDCDLLKHAEDVLDLTTASLKEEAIESKLAEISDDWSDAQLAFVKYKSRGDVLLRAADTAEIIEKLEDTQMALGSMATNRYSAPFKEEVDTWITKLSVVSEIVEMWLGVQAAWTYMEAVFSGGDIAKQLPQEAKRFASIDKNFMKLVEQARDTLNVVQTCYGNDQLKNMLPHLTEQLELCQKSLNSYLEAKRAIFPRFYFVSDPTLLEILSMGSDPQAVQQHFQSGLFDSLAGVTFDKADKSKMLVMHSSQGEEVPFSEPVIAQGNIELWLGNVVQGMQDTMKDVIRAASTRVDEMGVEEFIFSTPAQVALLGIQFQWTNDCTEALKVAKTDKNAMGKALKKIDGILRGMVEVTTKELSKLDRRNVETCVTVHVHQRDSFEEICKLKVKDPSDFDWMKQARFYWREDKNTTIISVADVDFEYSYEYLGVKERLVITPLTDRCYVTLSQALGMFLGGAPAGPAGTGKTETTKDMGATLGKYVVVFNCSDQMNYVGMGKIYRGLAQSGLWGCFDEFNRINLDVLSVCAQQVFCVLSAIRERKASFVFTDGAVVSLDPRVGFFITMNPGYAGRQELPENLKSLFRGCMMMVPNRQTIMKVKLAACGYQENEVLAKKFFVLYGLCEEQLSKQRHYDFGLRNILSVLRTAGTSKRANPDLSETLLVMRTLRDMNLSKFVAEDVPLFLSLIGDLFPGLKADKAAFPDVEAALKKQIAERGLQDHPSWFAKCVQLYETYQVRHGIMLVGPTGGGKTTIYECLAAALSEVGPKHVVWKMNPKAITAPQMFGKLDATTGDWTDGVFSVLWRKAAKAKQHYTWIVLDGPVDAIWIENLNTVLDDNKVLTLANGDRVQMLMPNMKAFFEPENLNNASPATVSRAGIIYVSDVELGWRPPVDSWLETRRAPERELLKPCFDKYVNELLRFVRVEASPAMRTQEICLTATLTRLLTALLADADAAGEVYSEGHYERLFLYAAAWSLGGLLEVADRPKFDAKLRELTDNVPPQGGDGEGGAGDTIFEYYVDDGDTTWAHWRGQVPAWEYPLAEEKPRYASFNIPTLDSTRIERLLSLVAQTRGSALLCGLPGTGKTSIINAYLASMDKEATTHKSMTFSSLTTPGIFQKSIEASVEKRQGRTFGPSGGKRMCVFIDDIALPTINEWGDQVTNEIVRQLLAEGGFYNLAKPGDMKMVVDVLYLAAMGTPGGGKQDIPNRLKRQFCMFNVPPPSTDSINNIYGQLVSGRFHADVFDAAVVEAAAHLVPTTISLWESVSARMLPTPAKFHYIWSMRELSRVFQGVILAGRDRFNVGHDATAGYGAKVESPAGYLVSLWRHECARTFADKLTSAEDKGWFEAQVDSFTKGAWGAELAAETAETAYFVDFLRPPVVDEETGETLESNPSFYEAAPGLDALREMVNGKQAEFNEGSKVTKLELVLFKDALEHMCRISRVLAMDGGNGLLVGVGGSGKQSLTRLAAYVAGANVFSVVITKTYNVTNLFDDIRQLYKTAGHKGKKMAWIFTDADIKEEAFLEYINQFLMTGQVAGLFTKEELDAMVNDMRPVAKAALGSAFVDSYDNLLDFFFDRVRQNLHLVLCFSPVGDKFARRAQQFPGLINGCTIDWFLPWPLDALTAVANKFIGDFEMHDAVTPEIKEQLVQHMGSVHTYVTAACDEYLQAHRRHVYVTPKSYLSFIGGYKSLYGKKLNDVQELASSINSGLEKMVQATEDVDVMKKELAVKNAELAEAQQVSTELLKEISSKTAIAEKEKAKVGKVKTSCQQQAEEIGAVKADAERDLAAAKPALEAAVSALSSITNKDIGTLKQLKNPPDVVKRIFDAVLVLSHKKVLPIKYQDVKGNQVLESNYSESAVMMGKSTFLQDLMNFPKETINDETCELLEPYFMAPDFNFEAAKKASGNVAGMCNWASAMSTYHYVAKDVEPKIAKLRESEAELKVAQKQLDEAEAKMATVQAELDDMQASFDQAMREKQRLEDDALATQKKMDSANSLIGALAGEKSRWTEQSAAFEDQIARLTGDCAVASAFVAYAGPFNKEFRHTLLTRDFAADCQRRSVPVTDGLSVTDFLVTESEVGEWNLQGLPNDDLSVQNGILVTRATRWPLLIDPQGQGLAWIRAREEANQLRVTGFLERQFRNHLEDCLSYGKPMLVANIEEELDPVLDPVLEKRFIKSGKGYKIALADKEVDYAETFNLIFTTRLPNPHYTPELSAKVTVIDFTVTLSGLEDQLLNKLILKEKYELEEQRMKLVEEVTNYKRKVKQLEDDLLFRLSSSSGNLLDDTELIDVLANTKATAQEVNEKLQNASETNKRITEACEEYRPVAHRAALIYFLIADWASVNVMYQTALNQFNEIYLLAIDNSDRATMPSKRIANIISHLTYQAYLYVQRGLFERHKLTFALMLAIRVQLSAGIITQDEFDCFLKCGSALNISDVRKKPKDWVPDAVWLNTVAMSGLPNFSDMCESVTRNDGLWRLWFDSEAPEASKIPDYEDKASKFERMCVVRAWREDRTLIAAAEYIAEALGPRFVESVPLSMEGVLAETTPRTPVIAVLSPGADPTKLIEDLAKKRKIKVLGVSMGQGQEVIARKYLATATMEGQWVLLQNTHLGLGYLQEVEQFLVKATDLHENFRLFLTAEPHPAFPIGLLQMGIKLTNEAPTGLKAGLRNSYAWVNQDMLDAVSGTGAEKWRQLLFVQCFLHSILQERRKFGPIGWNIAYEFNQSDLTACTQFLQNHLLDMEAKKSNVVTWSTVRYMVADIQYGGRITDDYDRLLMMTYSDAYFHEGMLAKGCQLQPGYEVVSFPEIEAYHKHFDTLPGTESPEIYGMHSNADLTYRTLQVQASLDTILETMPKTGGGSGGLTREEQVDKICEDLLGKMPAVFKPEDTKEKLKKLGGGSTAPLNVHLRQEIDRLNVVIKLTQGTLSDLRLAIAGTIALNDGLLKALNALFDARIPPAWLDKSWDAGSLGLWFTGLTQRFDQLSKWLNGGRPKAFWMTGFFNPGGFLTAMKQDVSRKHAADKWALDDVVMTSEVTHPAKEFEQLREGPSEGVYIYGLYLDGASWNAKENKLVDAEPKKLYSPLPVLYVTGVLANQRKTDGIYQAPAYRVKKRTGLNYITAFDLRTEEPASHWIMRGAALLCTTS